MSNNGILRMNDSVLRQFRTSRSAKEQTVQIIRMHTSMRSGVQSTVQIVRSKWGQ